MRNDLPISYESSGNELNNCPDTGPWHETHPNRSQRQLVLEWGGTEGEDKMDLYEVTPIPWWESVRAAHSPNIHSFIGWRATLPLCGSMEEWDFARGTRRGQSQTPHQPAWN